MTLRAEILSLEESQSFLRDKQTSDSATERAARIVAEAEAKAEAILAEANTDAEAYRKDVRQIADDALVDFVNVETIEKTNVAFRDVLATSRTVSDDFQDLRPWLTDVVLTALRRIIGTFDESDVMRRLISQVMTETQTRWAFAIRIHPSRQDDVRAMLREHADELSPIKEVQTDADMSEDLCLLVGAGGILDVSLPTQLDALRRLLDGELSG